mgnify:CR=1 FL=1
MFELANNSNSWDWCYAPNAITESHVNQMGKAELLTLLDEVILAWNNKSIRPSHIYSVTEIIRHRVNKLEMSYSNNIPIPICYFTDVQTIGALMVQIYLEVNQIKTTLQGLKNGSDLAFLIKDLDSKLPPGIIFSFSSFHLIDTIKPNIKQLLSLRTKFCAGGLIFNLNKSLKRSLPGFIFPSDLPDLVQEIMRGEL